MEECLPFIMIFSTLLWNERDWTMNTSFRYHYIVPPVKTKKYMQCIYSTNYTLMGFKNCTVRKAIFGFMWHTVLSMVFHCYHHRNILLCEKSFTQHFFINYIPKLHHTNKHDTSWKYSLFYCILLDAFTHIVTYATHILYWHLNAEDLTVPNLQSDLYLVPQQHRHAPTIGTFYSQKANSSLAVLRSPWVRVPTLSCAEHLTFKLLCRFLWNIE